MCPALSPNSGSLNIWWLITNQKQKNSKKRLNQKHNSSGRARRRARQPTASNRISDHHESDGEEQSIKQASEGRQEQGCSSTHDEGGVEACRAGGAGRGGVGARGRRAGPMGGRIGPSFP
ncbi:hypothetical protein PVAP13_9NG219373 [Panicum virgatum]|uniref:Uncharacterized protein n=1 Tax=Panicum virgatum TaxID=38727 RepID=A0A8T0MJ16_PANVG|nr:hypothetical protein PVAP13_9NG219373 [Panicum virgatum]